MHLLIVTPHTDRVATGNQVTADRYASILRGLGHQVRVLPAYDRSACDGLIALHARRSFPSIQRFASQYPHRPLIVVLTGTDLYRDIRGDPAAQRSLDLASHLVV